MSRSGRLPWASPHVQATGVGTADLFVRVPLYVQPPMVHFDEQIVLSAIKATGTFASTGDLVDLALWRAGIDDGQGGEVPLGTPIRDHLTWTWAFTRPSTLHGRPEVMILRLVPPPGQRHVDLVLMAVGETWCPIPFG